MPSDSYFRTLDTLPPDPILGLMGAFAADPAPDKVDLTVGVYRDESGATPVPRAVAAAERAIVDVQGTKTYLPPLGVGGFLDGIAALAFGTELPGLAGRLARIQTPGGCGALRLGAELVRRAAPGAPVLVSDPTWGNHRPLLGGAGLAIDTYPYYDAARRRLAGDAMQGALDRAAAGTVVLLQASCHNPTGVDPTDAEWDAILETVVRRRLVPFFDIAYQGLGRDPDADAYPIRAAVRRVPEFLVAVSCSKNLGLYRERTGALLVAAADAARREAIESHLRQVARAMYSMAPAHGALLAARVFADPALAADWRAELATMATRMRDVRAQLAAAIAAVRPDVDAGWLTAQRGMFSLLGIGPDAVVRLRERDHVYVVGDGRINVAGLTSANVERVARALAPVLAGS